MTLDNDAIELAGCIILDGNNHVLLLHRNTPVCKQWEVPGGKIEPGETPEAAAIRELKEETGLDVEISFSIWAREFEEAGERFVYHLFLAQITRGKPKIADKRFDKLEYLSLGQVKALRGELSAHAQKVLEEFEGGAF